MGLTTMLRRTRPRQRTRTPKRSPSPAAGPRRDGPLAGLLGLQRSAGNLAVRGLLDSADPAIAHGVESVPPAVHEVVAGGGGRPLEPDVSAELEPLVGDDLSGVRVHDDAAAARSAEAIDANAYAAGEHVVFGPGRYAPHTDQGRALVAHEVGHVVAGRQRGGAPVQRQPKERGGVKERATLLEGVPAPRVSQFGSTTVATIYFAHDAFLMERGGFVAVQQLADQLAFMAKPMVSVDGYASAEGTEKRNEELGRMRREAIIAVLTSKAHGVAIGGSGHGATAPAVPETAKDPAELEAQRAQNRRATIVIMDMTSPTPPPGGGGGGKPPGPIPPIPPIPPVHEETEQEAVNRKLREALKLPVDLTPPKKSLSEQAAKWFDEQAERILSDAHVPKEWRGRIKDAARAAAEKGVDAALDSALDAAHVTGQSKDAVKSALKAAAQTKF
jgi:outer membrane protein OmpA-like peptidoglycan-associated protein